MASEKVQKAWSRAEADIKKGNYAGVLPLLEETDAEGQHAMTSVSYTHLTLPTIYSV